MKGQRRLLVLHARLRNNCSDLKSDFFPNHLTDSLLVVVVEISMKILFIISLNVEIIVIQD